MDNTKGVINKHNEKYSNFRALRLNRIFVAIKAKMLQNATKIKIRLSKNVSFVRQPMAQSKHNQLGNSKITAFIE